MSSKRRRRWRRWVLAWVLVGSLVGLAALAERALREGAAAELVRSSLVDAAASGCGLELDFSLIRLDLLAGVAELSGVAVRRAGRPLLEWERLSVRFGRRSLLLGRAELRSIELLSPRAVIRLEEGVWVDSPTCLAGGSGAPPPVSVGSLSVVGGRVELESDGGGASLHDLTALGWPSPKGLELRLGLDATARLPEPADEPVPTEKTVPPATSVSGSVRVAATIEGPLLAPTRVALHRVESSVDGLALDGSGALRPADLHGHLLVALDADLGVLASWLPGAGSARGRGSLFIEAAGSVASPRARGWVQLEDAGFKNFSFGDRTRVGFEAGVEGLRLEPIHVQLGPGSINANINVDFFEGFTVDASARTDRLSFARFMAALGTTDVWVDFPATGETKVRGTLFPFELSGPFGFDVAGVRVWSRPWHTASRAPRMLDVVPVQVRGGWTFTPEAIDFLAVELRTEATHGTADARVRHAAPGSVSVEVDFDRFRLRDLGAVGGLDLLGAGRLAGWLGGPFDQLRASGVFDLDGVSVADIALGGASGQVAWDGKDGLDFSGIEGRLGTVRWNGRLGVDLGGVPTVAARGKVTGGRLGDLLLPLDLGPGPTRLLGGKVRGEFALTGPPSAWSGPVRLDVEPLEVGGEAFGALSATGRLERGRVVLEEAVVVDGEARAQASGWLEPSTRKMELEAKLEGLQLDRRRFGVSLTGGVAASAQVRGSLMSPLGTGIVLLRDGSLAGERLGSGQLRLGLGAESVRVDVDLPEVRTSLGGVVRFEAGAPFEATVRLSDAPWPTLVGGLVGVDLQGTLSSKAELRGRLENPEATRGLVQVERLKGVFGGLALEVAPATLRLEDGHFALSDLRIEGRDLRLGLSGRVGRSFDLGFDGRLDLRVLSSWVPPIERSLGSLSVQGRLAGAKGELDLLGTGQLEDVSLEWQGVPNRLTAGRGRLDFTKNAISLERFRARWAGGTLGADGTVQLANLEPRNLNFEIQVEGARPRLSLAYLDIGGRLDGRVGLDGRWPQLAATGALEVREARISPRTDLSDWVGSGRIAAAYDPSAELLELDIGLRFPDRIVVKNDDLDLGLRGALRLTGTNQRLGLVGGLTLDQGGRVSLVGREYVTEAGMIELADEFRFEPSYDLALSTSACDARVRVNLLGNLDGFDSTYSSNPEMDREDILSCLVRGIRRRDLDQDLTSFAGSALLKLSGVDRQVKRVLPIDQLDVTTEFSSRARAYEPRVLVAKDIYLLDRSLRLEYSASLVRNDDQRAALRVRLSPNVSLQLGWASSEDVPMGDLGLDLKRRWSW